MKKIEVKSFLDLKFVSNPIFSPDGLNAAFVVQEPCIKTNGYKGDIHLLNIKEGKVKKMTGLGIDKSYCWTKDNTLLFPSCRDKDIKERQGKGEKITAFYELSLEGGEANLKFTLPLAVEAIEDIGGGRYILTADTHENYPDLEGLEGKEKDEALKKFAHSAYENFTELPFWGNGAGYLSGRRTALYIYDSNKDRLKKLTDDKFDVCSWKYYKGKIAYQGGKFDSIRYIEPGLYIYDMEKKKSSCIFKPEKIKNGEFGFFDEKTLLLAATEGGKFGNQEYCDFYTVDLETKKLTKLADYDYPIGYGTIGTDSNLGGGQGFKMENGKAYFISTVDEASCIRSIDKEGNIEEVYNKGGACESFDIMGDKMVICAFEGNRLAELYNEKGEKLTSFNDKFTEEHSIVTPEPMSFVNKDGYEIRGWAMKPVGFKKGRKYPAILNVHGGPRTASGTIYYNEMQLWANAGFFVIYCNPRGSDGRGADFGYLTGRYGSIDFDDLMDFTDKMIEKYPEINAEKLGIAGGSYGGFMTNWAIGHTDRFKAAASQRSISNWISFEHTTDIGYFFTKNQMGTTTRQDVDSIWSFSPLKYADKAKTPTLFIHSDNDYRCWMAEGISMFTALKLHGVPSRFCLFKGENHELSRSGKPRNRVRRLEEILSWMEKYLGE